MGDTSQRHTLEFEHKGAEQAAGAVDKVSGAQEKLTEKTKDQVDPTKQQTEAQDELTASQSEYVEVLTKVNPQLGAMVDGMLKAGVVAGDLASQNISLTGGFAKLSAAVTANAATLKLLGAAGVALMGFQLLSGAIAKVREESRKLREELDQLRAYQTGRDESVFEAGHNIAHLARSREEGGLTGEQQAAAEAIYKQAVSGAETRGGVTAQDMTLLQQNIAALVGLISGPDIERLTMIGLGVDVGLSAERRQREAERTLADPDTQVAADRELQRQRQAWARERADALASIKSDDPARGEAGLDRLIERFAAHLDEESRETVKRKLREYMGFRRGGSAYSLGATLYGTEIYTARERRGRSDAEALEEARTEGTNATEREIEIVRMILKALGVYGMAGGGGVVQQQNEAARQQAEAAAKMSEAAGKMAAAEKIASQPPVINQYHPRIGSQRGGEVVNGATRRERNRRD